MTNVERDDAWCIECGYSLYRLPESRCPECGRTFETDKPWTMHVGRLTPKLVRRLALPMSVWVRRTMLIACGAILWGAAWLPGGQFVEAMGWNVLIVTVAYGLLRRTIRFAVRSDYRRTLERPDSERFSRRQVIFVALAMSAPLGWWPLRASLLIQRPPIDWFGRQTYEVDPMLQSPPTPRMVGLYLVTHVRAEPHMVTFHVLGGGRLYYCGDARARMTWRDRGLPWYLLWATSPHSGKWVADPEGMRPTRIGFTPDWFWK